MKLHYIEDYTRQLNDGLAAIDEVRAMHRIFAVLCDREGGRIVLSAADLEKAQRQPERVVTVTVDQTSGDVEITTHQR